MTAAPNSLRDVLPEYLAAIDDVLSADAVELRERPLRAALLFVEHFVIDVSDGTLANPISQPWFDAIHVDVLRWYTERYGAAVAANPTGSAYGLVLFHGAAFGLSIPLVVTRDGDAPGYRWIYFPTTLRSDEDPLTFVVAAPDLTRFDGSARDALVADIIRAVSQTRSLGLDLQTATVPDGAPRFADQAMLALSRGAEAACSGDSTRRSMAMWEFTHGVELTLKAFLLQRGVTPEFIHDPRRLWNAAVEVGLTRESDEFIAMLPSGSAAVNHRYGVAEPPDTRAVTATYRAALGAMTTTATQLRRSIVFRDAAIKVRLAGTLAHESRRMSRPDA